MEAVCKLKLFGASVIVYRICDLYGIRKIPVSQSFDLLLTKINRVMNGEFLCIKKYI